MFKNYELEQQQQIDELQGTGYVLRHKKTGARVVLIQNKDENKVFSIGFRTPPSDDTGVAHILEHSVLCGSAKFPSKDPFVELAKGSLNTFLNAMTYSDKTVYPIASTNATDFHNLMHVYLDAVFYPNIYKKEEILMQEGWHYEMDSETKELKFNGVVYNEMKGVFSSAESVLDRMIEESLLPDTPYAFESGGNPDAIPQLTREQFLAFHTLYYHPSNSYIYLYGDVDFEKELAFIDEEYLSAFDKREVDSEIAMQKPFDAPRTVTDTYSVSEDGEEEGIYLSYNTSYGKSTDVKTNMAIQILDAVLFTMPGAPVRDKLIKAGIGTDVDSSFEAEIQQPVYSIVATNVAKGMEQKFIDVLEDALREEVKNGINKKALYSTMNNYEFKFREADFGRFPKGLIYGLNFYGTWLYDDSKALALSDSIGVLQELKKEVETGYFEELIEKLLLKNNHKTYVNLYPEQGKTEKADQKLKEQLAAVKATLDKKQIYYLEEKTKKLKAFQEDPSPQEELEKIPMLEISDISTDILPLRNQEESIGGVDAVIHDYHTNGIVYADFSFDTSELPLELAKHATLLVDLFRYMDTEHYKYNDLATEINLKIGGMSFSTGIYPLYWKKDGFRPYFNIRLKCLDSQMKDGMELLKEVLLRTNFHDKARMKEIITEFCTRMEEKMPAGGHVYAANRAMSYVDPISAYKEAVEGITYYDLAKSWIADFDKNFDGIVKALEETCHSIFRKENLILSLTGDFNFKNLLENEIQTFAEALYTEPCVKQAPVIELQKKNEAFKTAGKVQYVAVAGSFDEMGRDYTGTLRVLKSIFSYGYLWEQVRVLGGAYGAMCGFTKNGYGYFTSYRDPNLENTLDVYKKAWEYVRDFTVSERDMKKYIIGTIGAMDQPLEPSMLGTRSFLAYQSGTTEEILKAERMEVLNTTQESIRALAPYIKALTDADARCTIGSSAKIEEAKELFNTTRNLVH